jgi:hypothetical protein
MDFLTNAPDEKFQSHVEVLEKKPRPKKDPETEKFLRPIRRHANTNQYSPTRQPWERPDPDHILEQRERLGQIIEQSMDYEELVEAHVTDEWRQATTARPTQPNPNPYEDGRDLPETIAPERSLKRSVRKAWRFILDIPGHIFDTMSAIAGAIISFRITKK